MNFDELKRSVLDNWWCEGSPLAWTTENPGIGLAHIAMGGQVGHFNLYWMMLQRREPPPLKVYQQTDMRWVATLSGQVFLQNRSLLEHASFKTYDEFSAVILSYCRDSARVVMNLPGGVPWHTLQKIAQRSFT